MAVETKNSLVETLNRVIKGDNELRLARELANKSIVDTLQCSTYSDIVTSTSASGVVNIPFVQPANTVIEDIIPICTVGVGHETATVGFRVGSTAFGGTEVIAAGTGDEFAGSGTSLAAGQGTSAQAHTQLSLQGGRKTVVVPGAGYTSTERTLYAQVSCSIAGTAGQGFKADTGAFRVIAQYYNL